KSSETPACMLSPGATVLSASTIFKHSQLVSTLPIVTGVCRDSIPKTCVPRVKPWRPGQNPVEMGSWSAVVDRRSQCEPLENQRLEADTHKEPLEARAQLEPVSRRADVRESSRGTSLDCPFTSGWANSDGADCRRVGGGCQRAL